jgi:hypothetical protein
MSPARRQYFGFQNDFGIGDVGNIHRFTGRQFDRPPANAAGDRHFIGAERRLEAGAEQFDGVRSNADRNRQRPLRLVGPLHEQAHVVGRHDIDSGQILFLDHEAVDAGVDSEFGIAGDDDAGGDHRAAIVNRRHRDRQLVKIDVIALHDDFTRRRARDAFRRNRVVDPVPQAILDLQIFGCAHGHHGPFARSDDAGHDRHFVTDDVVEKQSLVGLIDQGGNMADIDRLMKVNQLTGLTQAFEEFAEGLAHRGSISVPCCCGRRLKRDRPTSFHA